MYEQLDTENADLDISSYVTVLTHTPDASYVRNCQLLVYLGDGTKNLDGTGGTFIIKLEYGSQESQEFSFTVTAGDTRSVLISDWFSVPANVAIVAKLLSPNGADTDVDVTAYLNAMIHMLVGTDKKSLISTDAQDLSATLDVNAKTLGDDAITSAKYDESTAYPVASADSGATQIARVGADGDTLETLSDQLDAVETDTGEIGAAGAGLTAIPWNAAWDAEVESECNDALVALSLDHLLAVATAAADMTAEVVDNSVISRILANGDTSAFDPSTDGLQLIRDEMGGGNLACLETDVATADTALSFTLTAGEPTADAYNGMLIAVQDADDSHWEVRVIKDWTAGRVVTLNRILSFTPAVADVAYILFSSYVPNMVDAIAEITTISDVPSTPTLEQAAMLIYMRERNDTSVTSTERRIKNDAGSEILDATMSDDGSTFSQGKLTNP